MKNSRVFVTGGTGLVGGHVVEKLVENNNEVFVGWRSRDPKAYFFQNELEKKVCMVNYDLKDFRRVFDIISKYEIDTVIHLGAQPIVYTAYKNPYETLESNIMGTVNVLEACRMYGEVKSIVIASSDKAYGVSEVLPYTEEMKLNGQHPYDCSKSCTDLVSIMYAKTYDLPVTISRFGNIFGPGDMNFNRIIPGIMKSIIKGETLELRSDGSMIREYLYVKDVADGYLMLAENIEKCKGEAFNFGTAKKYTVLELIELCGKVIGKEVDYKIVNNAKGEIPAQYLDSSKLQQLLNWQCNENIEGAIKESYEWYKSVL